SETTIPIFAAKVILLFCKRQLYMKKNNKKCRFNVKSCKTQSAFMQSAKQACGSAPKSTQKFAIFAEYCENRRHLGITLKPCLAILLSVCTIFAPKTNGNKQHETRTCA
ncbi:MAG: hypothetical protein ACI30V_02410, partial [Muribaculaceae bacterium]